MTELLAYKRIRRLFKKPLQTSYGIFNFRESIILTIQNLNGQTGQGEIAPLPGFNSETIDECECIIQDILKTNKLEASIDSNKYPCIHHAYSAARIFNNDFITKIPEPPTHRITKLIARTPIDTPEEILNRIEKISNGTKTFKIKIGLNDLNDEIIFCKKLLSLSKQSLGDSIKFRFDANAKWEIPALPKFIALAKSSNLDFFEQLLNTTEEANNAIFSISDDIIERFALDESILTLNQIPQNKKNIVIIKPLFHPDLNVLRAWLKSPIKKQKFVISSVFESDVGRNVLKLLIDENKDNPRQLDAGIDTLHYF